MIDIKSLSPGDKIIWLGSAKTTSYGNRSVEAEVISIINDSKIKIKIKTPMGDILKYVSKNSIDYAKEK